MAGPLLETKLHVPRRRRGLVAASATERAPEPRGGVGADARLGAGRVRQDDAAGASGWRPLRPMDGPRRGSRSTSATTIPRCSGPTWSPRCRRRRPGSARARSSLLQSPQPPIEAVLATLLNDLGAISDDVVLVLDDYHVIDARDVQDGMAFLLEHLPAAAAPGDRQPRRPGAAAGPAARARRARRDPRRRPALHARRGRGVPQRGDGAGADGAGRRRAGGAHRRLDRRAPAGGALDAGPRRRRRRSSPASPATTATSSTTWSRRSCSASPSTSSDFLLQTSILDRLSGPLCDAVTGQDGGKAMLEALERGNLFLVPLDDRRQWYRYHHLFADVLQARLLDEQPDERPDAAPAGERLVRAATASRPRRSATRWPPRTSSGRRTWSSWRCRPCAGARQEATLRGWLEALPDELVRGQARAQRRVSPGRCWPAASSRASRPGCGTPSGGWTRPAGTVARIASPIGGDGRRRRRGVPPPPGDRSSCTVPPWPWLGAMCPAP